MNKYMFVCVVVIFSLLGQACSFANNNLREDELAVKWLNAIRGRDVDRIREVGNNPSVLDKIAIQYLVATSSPFVGKDRGSAYQVLAGGVVLHWEVASKTNPGQLDIIYVKRDKASTINELQLMIRRGEAKVFRDYILCSFVLSNGRYRILDACGAESDAWE